MPNYSLAGRSKTSQFTVATTSQTRRGSCKRQSEITQIAMRASTTALLSFRERLRAVLQESRHDTREDIATIAAVAIGGELDFHRSGNAAMGQASDPESQARAKEADEQLGRYVAEIESGKVGAP